MKLIAAFTSPTKSRIEVGQYDHLSVNTIVIHDLDAQIERRYTIGRVGELEMAEDKVLIQSHEQVIAAWENGAVWF